MESTFTAEFFSGNRQRLRDMFTGKAPIVLTANGQLQRGGDSTFPFQQDASFWYLTGLNQPDVLLVMDKDKEYLIVPELSDYQNIFDGRIDTAEFTRQSGIQTILSAKDGWKQLSARLKKVKHIATLAASPQYVETYGLYTNPARRQLIKKLKAENDELELLDLREHLSRLRMIKQPIELDALQQAIDTTIDTLKEVFRPSRLSKYGFEYQLEADISRGFRYRGAHGHAFAPIVAAGARACTLHLQTNDSALSADELVVVDVGAEVEHYAADITRTVSLNGKPSRRQRLVHQAVLDVQEYALTLVKPGALIKENEKAIEQFMGEKLRELGLIKIIEQDTVRRYFPHNTSHFLGLDVHDAGDYDRPLEAGVVITVEPGIYILDEAIGVRIEDDVLITADGYEVLSKRLPRELT
jgi:Xaa-Pro aminopeptidase